MHTLQEDLFGGNRVTRLAKDPKSQPGTQFFAQTPYVYYLKTIEAPGHLVISDLKSYSVVLLSADSKDGVRVTSLGQTLLEGGAVQSENCSCQIEVQNGRAVFLVAGTREAAPLTPTLVVTPSERIKKVTKPWGYELWINSEHPNYAFKNIFIRAGTKTSLQYHRMKQETNVLFSGSAQLHYKDDASVELDATSPSDVSTVLLEPVSSVDVVPNTLHRLEAVTDVLLYEVSTPHLNDVVRLSDDTSRPSGRIESEHKSL